MQIQPIGVQTNYKASFSPNFKSCYPVTHWLAEANESYAPVLTTELAKKLQGILVRYLNASAKKYSGKKAAFCQEVKDFMASTDRDYANLPFVRSFYDKKGGFKQGKITPLVYMLTGFDAKNFDRRFGLPIGSIKGSCYNAGIFKSAELNMALTDYFNGGLQFVKDRSKEFCDKNKVPYGLHAKFQTLRNKSGNIKGFELMELSFCPEIGPDNPLEKFKNS